MGDRLTRQEALCQSLAACGAFLIAFIGTVHETVGAILYPWAPHLFGPVGFQALGLGVMALGLVMLLGTLRVIRVPVAPLAIATSIGTAAMFVFIEVTYHQFHYFCVCASIAGLTTAYFHTKATQQEA